MIINREGFGEVLADGVKKASEKIGKKSEKFAIHAGGQELPMHDSRLDHGFAVAYQCEPTPGRHTISGFLYGNLYSLEKQFPEVRRRLRRIKGKEAKNLYRFTAGIFYAQLLNGCGMCMFGALTSTIPIAEYLNAATGWGLSNDEYLRIGERILNIRKAFNAREGLVARDQKLNERAAGEPALLKGPLKGISVNIEKLQKEFFDIVGWSHPSGGPTAEKMKQLGIDALFEHGRL